MYLHHLLGGMFTYQDLLSMPRCTLMRFRDEKIKSIKLQNEQAEKLKEGDTNING
jgi:hypothetical protein